MNKNDFAGISIKGRVSYSICCLESALINMGCKIKDWKIILKQLWTYTNVEFFEDWHYSTSEFLPESILEFNEFDNNNFEYINEETYLTLYKLYKSENDIVKNLVKLIFNIGISEFYGRLENQGQQSLNSVEILLNYMNKNKIPLPDISKFQSLSYSEGNGWGNDFDGRSLSTIL